MKEIIEILLEGVELEKLVELLIGISSSSTLKDYQISTDVPEIEINFQSQAILYNDINQSSDGSFYFNFLDFNLGGLMLQRAGVQIYKYDSNYDLNLHIDQNEISQNTSVADLQSWVKSLSKDLKAKDYFCGYEPVTDEETRFFSGMTLGPLKKW